VFVADFLYYISNSLTWSLASSGFFCIPIIPLIALGMPETLPVGLRKPMNLTAIIDSLRSQPGILTRILNDWTLICFFVVIFALQLADLPIQTIALYWGQWKFGWNTTDQAIFINLSVSATLLGSLLGPRLFLNVSDDRNTNAAYALMVISMVFITVLASAPLAFSTSSIGVMVSIFFFSFGIGCSPALTAQISAHASGDELGQLQGISSSVSMLARTAGIYAFWGMFEAAVDDDFDDDANSISHQTDAWGSFMWIFIGFFLSGVIILEFFVYRESISSSFKIHFGQLNESL